MARRLRVIYSDLSEFIGTTADWDDVRDGILIVQIEQWPGHWLMLHGHDWYYVDGDHAGGYTEWTDCNRGTGAGPEIAQRRTRRARAGKLVDHPVWQRAKAMGRQPLPPPL